MNITVKYCLFLCLFRDFRQTRKFFIDNGTSKLAVKDKFLFNVRDSWPLSSMVFLRVQHLLWYRVLFEIVISEDDQLRALIPIAKRLTVKISLPVLTTKVCRSRVSNTRMRGERSNRLHHCNKEKNACKTKTKKWTYISELFCRSGKQF